MVQVKVCGITNLVDAMVAVEAGADALGFVFYPKSPRFVELAVAKSIIAALPPFTATVGVFVDEKPDHLIRVKAEVGLSVLQLHGSESPDMVKTLPGIVVKGFRVGENFRAEQLDEYKCSAYLLDAYVKGIPGGTGVRVDWEFARACAQKHRVILAGGLDPTNVAEAVREVRPYAVDVSSGVELAPRRKDPLLIQRFILAAKQE